MSKGIEKPSFEVLCNDLMSIIEINERVKTLRIIRLKELENCINELFGGIFKKCHKEFKLGKPLMNCIDSTSFCGFDYERLKFLQELIQNRINFLTVKQNNTFNDLIFKDPPSERFFIYVVENWLKEEINKTTALRFVFTKMWYKNDHKETPYKIISTQPYFACDYWNLKYSNIYEFTNPKNPRLNKDSFTDYYHNRFKKLLTEFQGG